MFTFDLADDDLLSAMFEVIIILPKEIIIPFKWDL